jgi:hypothetical protein
MVFGIGVWVCWVGVFLGSRETSFPCRWCPCIFCSVSDLELHLKFFGDKDHSDSWRVMHSKTQHHWKRVRFPNGELF